MEYSIFCNQNINVEEDTNVAMVAGVIACPKEKVDMINQAIYEIKVRHGLSSTAEIKWTKVSESKYDMYKDLIDLFFDNAFISFRATVAKEKKPKNWYKRTYYMTLRDMLEVNNEYKVYVADKDINDEKQLLRMSNIVHTATGYFYEDIVKGVQLVDPQQFPLIQLTDLLIGAVAYVNKGLVANSGKMKLINYIEELSGVSLNKITPKVQVKNKISVFKL